MTSTTPNNAAPSGAPQATAPANKEGSTVNQLDALLREHERHTTLAVAARSASDPAAQFRSRFPAELTPVLEETAEKYCDRGIDVRWNTSTLLSGGRELSFELEFEGQRLILKGMLARDVIAFQEIWSRGNSPGEVRSGPMLRLRAITPDVLREFLCGQIAALVKAVMRDKHLAPKARS